MMYVVTLPGFKGPRWDYLVSFAIVYETTIRADAMEMAERTAPSILWYEDEEGIIKVKESE